MDLKTLRNFAITNTLFPPTSLPDALNTLGFVQADPIRSPARAQDLILRQRVTDYHAGDLEQSYSSLGLEEDFLYAYGFFPTHLGSLHHPKKTRKLTAFEEQVLEWVQEHGKTHPRELEVQFGKDRAINGWGSFSKATKLALEHLHYAGFLRIAGREKGIRLYESANWEAMESPKKRLEKLAIVIVNILQPLPERSLNATIMYLVRHSFRGLYTARDIVEQLVKNGHIVKEKVDGTTYVWDPAKIITKEVPATVKLLAPFDPLVWDRQRFEHFWGWPYRFEAYVPPPKRIRGYYTLPLLWKEDIIGWANANIIDVKLKVDVGYVNAKPKEKNFESELKAEIKRLREFLKR